MKNLRSLIILLPTLIVFFGLVPDLATAQTGMISETECRCVDPDGNEIENCRCFRTFEPGQFAWNFASPRSTGARIGITLSVTVGEENARGARIESVLEDGPADRAGLQEGDVVTHVDGQSLFEPLEDPAAEGKLDLDESLPTQRLLQLARGLEPGDEVEIGYLRNGDPGTTVVTAEVLDDWEGNVMFLGGDTEGTWNVEEFRGQFEDMAEKFKNQDWSQFQFDSPWVDGDVVVWGDYFNTCPVSEETNQLVFGGNSCLGGLRIESLNPKLGEYFGTQDGVLVADVHPDSPLGLEPGDVILGVGDRKATTPQRLRRILRSFEPDEEITLQIMRQTKALSVSGTLAR